MNSIKSKIITSLLIVMVGSMLMAGGSVALFTSQVTNSGNTFAAGTVVLEDISAKPAVSTTKYFNNLAPGDSETFDVKVVNKGTLDARVRIKEIQKSGAVFEGKTPLTLEVVNPASQIIKPGETATFQMKYHFPIEADNSYQGAKGSANIVVYGEQTRNNAEIIKLSADLTKNPMSSTNFVMTSGGATFRPDFSVWALMNNGFFQGEFSIDSIPATATLSLSQLSAMIPGGGYSPISILVNGKYIVNHQQPKGSAGYVLETFNVPAELLVKGKNVIRIEAANDMRSQYWLQLMTLELTK